MSSNLPYIFRSTPLACPKLPANAHYKTGGIKVTIIKQ
jgi:hypothetical protein